MINLPDQLAWVDLTNKKFENTLNLLLNSEDDIFVCAGAGRGKSTLIKCFCALNPDTVVLAPTGIAAINLCCDGINAKTLHSFFRIKPQEIIQENTEAYTGDVIQAIRKCRTMIIDEISMVSNQLMDYIHQFMCSVRKDHSAPRMLFFGDVMQLPPVIGMTNPLVKDYYEKNYNGNVMFFHSKYYKKYTPKVVSLYKSYRQNDIDFIEALTNIAIGDYEQTNLDYLNQQVMSLPTYEKNHKNYIYLTPTNAVADKRNKDYLKSLSGQSMTYKASYSKDFPDNKKPTDDIIEIKEGAQIMCTMNHNDREERDISYRNGTLGTVTHVDPNYVEIEDENGKIKRVVKTRLINYKMKLNKSSGKIEYEAEGWYEQIDCKIARACTIHKSQSKSFDHAYIALMGWVPESVTYVGLSRLRTLQGLGLNRAITPSDIKIYKESLDFIAGIEEITAPVKTVIEDGDELI